ncbi:peptide ABC transporter substrate-binding protein [Aerococcaceae bacterium DSM 111021]|nr:peptide ABC transporter substrate-binding protein [Aerococcaceae bacterium DSM 111021]
MKRKIAYAVSLFMLIGLVISVFSSNQTTATESKQTLNLATANEPVVDPGLATDKNSIALIANIFDGLTRPTIQGNVEPGIAESWDVSEDLLTYTFHLRESSWSDGTPLTAEDFEYAWKRVLNPETASPGAFELYMIEGAEAYHQGEGVADDVKIIAVDDLTLEVTLNQPTPQFLEYTGRLPELYPVPRHIVAENSEWGQEVGELFLNNGPFMLSEWNHQSDYTITKNPTYWDSESVQLETIHVQIVESMTTANTMYLNGDLDYLGMPFHTISPEMIDIHKESGELKVSDMAAFYNYAMNINDPHLSNVNIRKALALAVNRQGLIENVTKAGQTPALRIVGPTATNATQDQAYIEDADFDQARKYLAKGLEELGLNQPSDLQLSMSTNVSEEHSAVAQFIQAGWIEELGIDVTIETTEFQVHLSNMSQLDYQLGRRGEGYEYSDIASFIEQYYSTSNGRNHTGWEDENYQRLVQEAQSEKDIQKRELLLLEAEAIFMDAMPIIPLYFYTNAYVVKDNVHNMEMDTIGVIQFKDVYID